jgi:lipopolysaccharide transport system permease protein
MTATLPGTQFCRNLVERRSLLFQLVRRDFEQRFVGSAIGWVWSLINPLVLLVSWYFAFTILLRIPVNPQEVTKSYPL